MLAVAALAAADFWDEKGFMTWSDKDVEKMLTDSPWAKTVRIPVRGPTGDGGFGGWGGIGIGGGGGRQPPIGSGPPRLVLTVSWRSALPVKQAFVRSQTQVDAEIGPDAQQFLAADEPFYVVSVTGLPEQFERLLESPATLEAETVLELGRRPPISPESASVFREGEWVTIVWSFPRTRAITLGDKEVEFITKLGPLEVKKKFKLADMEFGGELAL